MFFEHSPQCLTNLTFETILSLFTPDVNFLTLKSPSVVTTLSPYFSLNAFKQLSSQMYNVFLLYTTAYFDFLAYKYIVYVHISMLSNIKPSKLKLCD